MPAWTGFAATGLGVFVAAPSAVLPARDRGEVASARVVLGKLAVTKRRRNGYALV